MVCSAVRYAHQSVVIHRDLKPGNILVTGERQVKLLDFGIARLLDFSESSETSGALFPALTSEYASPEQIKGEVTTPQPTPRTCQRLIQHYMFYALKQRTTGEPLKAVCEQEPRLSSTAKASPWRGLQRSPEVTHVCYPKLTQAVPPQCFGDPETGESPRRSASKRGD